MERAIDETRRRIWRTFSARSCPPGTNLQMTVAASNHRFASSNIDELDSKESQTNNDSMSESQ